jgi:hypothetical protein
MLFYLTMLPSFACEDLASLPETVQVVWISPAREQVRLHEDIEVIRLQDLRVWLEEEDASAKELLHQMGMLSKRSWREIDPSDYKITIFDINRNWLCRPMTDEIEGTIIEDIPVCQAKQSKPTNYYTRYGFTGCGYSFNTLTAERGFDVYRIDWSDAATWGFCVMPLDRFLSGPPK